MSPAGGMELCSLRVGSGRFSHRRSPIGNTIIHCSGQTFLTNTAPQRSSVHLNQIDRCSLLSKYAERSSLAPAYEGTHITMYNENGNHELPCLVWLIKSQHIADGTCKIPAAKDGLIKGLYLNAGRLNGTQRTALSENGEDLLRAIEKWIFNNFHWPCG